MKRGFLKADYKAASPAQAEAKPSKPVFIPVSPQATRSLPQRFDPGACASLVVTSCLYQLNIPTHCLLYDGTKEALLKQLKPVKSEIPSSSLPFETKEVPGQGIGAFAKKAYNIGDPIWDERPLFVVPQGIPSESEFPREHYFKSVVEKLPPHVSFTFYRLHNCKSEDPKDIIGIIETNAIGIGRLPGPYEGDYAAVFFLISRFNHSCVPNVDYHWDIKTFKYYLTANRHIAAGEQLFVAYCPIFDSRTERQEALRSKYAFTCTCASCSLPKDLSARSDVKRKILSSASKILYKQQKEHERALKEWIKDLSLPDNHILKPAQFLMQLMQEEQAFDCDLWLTQAEIVCKALCALSDRAGVVELAKKASLYAKTTPSGDYVSWSEVAAAPEKTEWWGLRKKITN